MPWEHRAFTEYISEKLLKEAHRRSLQLLGGQLFGEIKGVGQVEAGKSPQNRRSKFAAVCPSPSDIFYSTLVVAIKKAENLSSSFRQDDTFEAGAGPESHYFFTLPLGRGQSSPTGFLLSLYGRATEANARLHRQVYHGK